MDLRVEIPKRFKKLLQQRFDLRRAICGTEKCYIPGGCPLCAYYERCYRCPFGKFHFCWGCVRWVHFIIKVRCFSMDRDISWYKIDDKKARRQIKKLKRKARKLITWV